MTFKESIQTCFSKYADFNGRASRPEYWWFFLFIVLVGVACSFISTIVSGLFTLATLVPSIAAAARRMHDTDKSAWLLLIGIIPLVGLVLLYFLAQPGKEPNRFGPATST